MFAAANPIGGRYDPSYTLAENVELTDPILQRFDVLCVLQDIVDPVVDEQLAGFVVTSHMKSHPNHRNELIAQQQQQNENENENEKEIDRERLAEDTPDCSFEAEGAYSDEAAAARPLSQSMLKKYITYARAHVRPVIHGVDSEKVSTSFC